MPTPLSIARYARWRAAEYRRRARNRRLAPTELWRQELNREVGFWGNIIETEGGQWPIAWKRLFEPNAHVTDRLIMHRIDLIAADPVRILDVGAGPISVVGTTHPGRRLEITATDPLAGDYVRMLADAGLEPPVITEYCKGEDLLERFGSARFDFAYARNSVDHTVDPLTVLRNMLAVVKPGGFVLLRHYQNEGVAQEYEGLHQWNFDLREGRVILWNRRASHDLNEIFESEAEIEAESQPWTDRAPWIACAIHKQGDHETAD